MGDDRPSVYEEDGKLVFRASALGRCRTSLWYTREGYPQNPTSENVLKAWALGNEWEDHIIEHGMPDDVRPLTEDELTECGFVLSERGEDQIPQVELELHLGNNVIRCHPDGIATNDVDYVVEAKYVGPSLWAEMKQHKLGPYYQTQFDIEILAARQVLPDIQGLYIVAEKGEDGKPTGEYVTWVQEEPTITEGYLLRRMNDIRKASQPPTCDQNMWGCEFWPLCDKREIPAITDGLALEAAKIYAEADATYKVAAEARKQARKALLDTLKEKVDESTRVGEVTISVQERRGSIDMEALCHDHPNLDPEQYRKKPSQVVSLSVKQPESSSDGPKSKDSPSP